MPDSATQNGQDSQAAIANAPPQADEQRTQQQRQADLPYGKSFMDLLDIPKDVQGQIKIKPLEQTPPDEIERLLPPHQAPPLPQAQQPEPEPEPEQPLPNQQPEPEPEDEEEEEEAPQAAAQQQPVDKRQKRINKLTRQKNELANAVKQLQQQMQQMAAQMQGGQANGQQQQAPLPPAPGRLAYVKSEPQLNQELAFANSMIEWCDAHADGFQNGEKYISPEEIAADRRKAENVVMWAPNRRTELRDEQAAIAQFQAAKADFDRQTQAFMPEIFKEGTNENEAAKQFFQMYPFLAQLPMGVYATALMIEGGKSVDAKLTGPPRPTAQPRDIDARVFRPRVPLAPDTVNPPAREAAPSSTKKVNEAMSNLVRDTDGSAQSLAQVFGAIQEAQAVQGRPGSRTVVRR